MDPMTLMAAIGAGGGLVKGIGDKIKQDQDKKVQANLLRLSPWTHMSFNEIPKPRDADPLGNIMQGAAGGAGLGQNIQNAGNQNALMNAWLMMQNAPKGSEEVV